MGGVGSNQWKSRMRRRNAQIRSGSREGSIVPLSSDPEISDREDSDRKNDESNNKEKSEGLEINDESGNPTAWGNMNQSEGVAKVEPSDTIVTNHKDFLLEYLESIGNGSFAASGSLPDVNPGLSVEGLGDIGLPLSARDAKELARVCHQAPFGKGSETFVDTSVRKTWEINAESVRFRNPKWQLTVNHAVSKIIEELAIVGGNNSVKAQLHKLLLYEPGAFFETHRDTEKALGMIATMVISLPSQHSGGEVVLSLNSQKRTLQTEDVSDFGTKYLAWYADVNHAVKPVVSGHRLVLTYNLIRDGPAIRDGPPPSVQFDPVKNLELALSDWMSAYENRFVYMLEHEYSEANFGLGSLKGKDQLRMRYLADAARMQDVCVYFAHFEYSVSGGCEEDDPYDHYGGADIHGIVDEIDSNWKLVTLFTTEGDQIASDIDIDEDDFIQGISLQDESPDYEEFEGWTGNEGANTTHFYRRSCVVVFSREQRRELLKSAGSVVLDKWTRICLNEVEFLGDTDGDPVVRELIELSSLASRPTHAQTAFADPRVFIDLALRLKQPALLKSAAGKGLDAATYQKLGSSSLDFLDNNWLEGIQHAFSKTSPGRKRLDAIGSFILARKDSLPEPKKSAEVPLLYHKIMQSLPKMWNYDQDESREDAEALISLCQFFPGSFIHNVLLPLSKRTSNITFIESLARGIMAEVKRNDMDANEATNLCDEIFSILTSKIRKNCPYTNPDWRNSEQLKQGDDSVRLCWEAPCNYSNSWDRENSSVISAKTLLTIIITCEDLKLRDATAKFLDFLMDMGRKPMKAGFDTWLFPFLGQIPQSIIENNASRYQPLFQSIISSYISHFVPAKATRIRDWSHPKRGCRAGCMDCRDLDQFLVAADRWTRQFQIATRRRQHLEQQLRMSSCNVRTMKCGTPYTLAVDKTQSVERDDVETWQRLRLDAAGKIRAIGDERLKLMLGDEYGTILAPTGIAFGPPVRYENSNGSARPPLGTAPPASINVQTNKREHDAAFEVSEGGAKRVKREPEIIDLEGDDWEMSTGTILD